MLLVAYTQDARDRSLRRDERALLAPMVRRSDNAAASEIFIRLGTKRLERLARQAGMTRFKAASPIWGNSRITARDQTRFFLRIDTLLPPRHRAYGLRLLRQIVPSQRWGIGRLELPDWRVYFKGGWGAGTGAVDHQVVLLRRGEERIAIAVLTASNGIARRRASRRSRASSAACWRGWSRPTQGLLGAVERGRKHPVHVHPHRTARRHLAG